MTKEAMNNSVQELKQNIDLASVVRESGVELKAQGGRSVGICPFHTEKTPSFFVFPDNHFKCFSCQEYGDVIDFIQKLYGFSFPDALKHLGIDNQAREITPKMRKKIKQRKHRGALLKRFRDWERKKVDEIATLIRCTHKVAASWKSIEDFERGGGILQPLALYKYQLRLLIFDNDQEKLKFYKEAQHGRPKF